MIGVIINDLLTTPYRIFRFTLTILQCFFNISERFILYFLTSFFDILTIFDKYKRFSIISVRFLFSSPSFNAFQYIIKNNIEATILPKKQKTKHHVLQVR